MVFIREIPLASMLGYTEVEDFRRALSSGQIPAPHHYLGPKKKRPIWDQDAIDVWLGKSAKTTSETEVWNRIKQVA